MLGPISQVTPMNIIKAILEKSYISSTDEDVKEAKISLSRGIGRSLGNAI